MLVRFLMIALPSVILLAYTSPHEGFHTHESFHTHEKFQPRVIRPEVRADDVGTVGFKSSSDMFRRDNRVGGQCAYGRVFKPQTKLPTSTIIKS